MDALYIAISFHCPVIRTPLRVLPHAMEMEEQCLPIDYYPLRCFLEGGQPNCSKNTKPGKRTACAQGGLSSRETQPTLAASWPPSLSHRTSRSAIKAPQETEGEEHVELTRMGLDGWVTQPVVGSENVMMNGEENCEGQELVESTQPNLSNT